MATARITPMTKKTRETMTTTLEHVAPGELIIAANVRTDTKVSAEFIANIKENGVVLPILAERTPDGALEVIDGQRRTLAAVEAGLKSVPVFVAGGPGDASARMLTQITVNDQRESLGEAEHVSAYKQLSLFGVSAAVIAKKTGATKERVQKSLAVSDNVAAKTAFTDNQITLDQAAIIVDFADDAAAVKKLTAQAEKEPERFDHLVADLTRKRELATHRDELRATLAGQGITVLSDATSEYAGTAEGEPSVLRLSTLSLPTSPTVPLTAADVLGTSFAAGRIAPSYSHPDGGYREWATIQYFVLANHTCNFIPIEYARAALTEEQLALQVQRQEETDARDAHKAKLATGTTVRRTWLDSYFQRATRTTALPFIITTLTHDVHLAIGGNFPTAILPWLDLPTVTDGTKNHEGHEYSPTATEHVHTHTTGNPKKAEKSLLALAVWANEENLAAPWHLDEEQAAAYLEQLHVWGYGLSEVEQSIVDGPADA